MTLVSVMAEVNPDVAAGLIGFVGGFIAGLVSLKVARDTRRADERAWIRESRRAIYDRFLDRAQTLLIACEQYDSGKQTTSESVDDAFTSFFQAYGTVQTVADGRVIKAVRTHAYLLWELEEEVLGKRPVLSPGHAAAVERSVRAARHGTIDEMRLDLGLKDSAKPETGFNPFTEILESGARDDDVKALKVAYDDELEAAGDNRDKVRPGWEGSPHTERTGAKQQRG